MVAFGKHLETGSTIQEIATSMKSSLTRRWWPGVRSLYKETGLPTASLAHLTFAAVAISDESVVGAVGVSRSRDGLWVSRLAVKPAHQSQGLGREILRYAVTAHEFGGDEIVSLVPTVDAIPFYEGLGFRYDDAASESMQNGVWSVSHQLLASTFAQPETRLYDAR